MATTTHLLGFSCRRSTWKTTPSSPQL